MRHAQCTLTHIPLSTHHPPLLPLLPLLLKQQQKTKKKKKRKKESEPYPPPFPPPSTSSCFLDSHRRLCNHPPPPPPPVLTAATGCSRRVTQPASRGKVGVIRFRYHRKTETQRTVGRDLTTWLKCCPFNVEEYLLETVCRYSLLKFRKLRVLRGCSVKGLKIRQDIRAFVSHVPVTASCL